MKKFKYYLCTLACAITVSSCSLDETSYTEIEKGNYMKNAAEAENVLLGVYRDMVQDGIYGFHLSLYFTIPSDIAKVTGNSTDGLRLIPSNAYTSSQTEIATTWANLYSATMQMILSRHWDKKSEPTMKAITRKPLSIWQKHVVCVPCTISN